MKKWIVILFLLVVPGFTLLAQDEETAPQEGKIQERMRTYIQNKLHLNKNEAEKFTPIFIRYFRDFVQTHRENKGDRLVLQQKVVELRLRYRGEFKQILDEQRANKVYVYEDQFRKEVVEMIKERRREAKPIRRNRAMFQ